MDDAELTLFECTQWVAVQLKYIRGTIEVFNVSSANDELDGVKGERRPDPAMK